MNRVQIWGISVTWFLLVLMASSEDEEVRKSLVHFMEKLSPGDVQREPNFGWNLSSDPCTGRWKGVSCDSKSEFVRRIVLDQFNLSGVLDPSSICIATTSLFVLSLNENNVGGEIPDKFSNCRRLTHLYVSGNRFSGNLPPSLSRLNNLRRIDLSNNGFSGEIPADLSRISGLLSFLAQNNQLRGEIPKFDFSNLQEFNVANNNLGGEIPDVNGRFDSSCFLGNPGLCGKPLPNACPPRKKESKGSSRNKILMYLGYGILVLIIVILVALKLVKKKRSRGETSGVVEKRMGVDNGGGNKKNNGSSREGSKERVNNRSEYSITSIESGSGTSVSSSLVILSCPVAMINGLKFEDLLRAPAELVGRGKNGSLYKVVVEVGGGVNLAVKRMRDCGIPKEDFKMRMERMNQLRHPNVLPAVAYYCSQQERLLVYEFQQNGSLFNLLHGSKNGRLFGWGSRVSVAASIAESLAFMHEELRDDRIAHGNLKSSNILLNNDMEPCISEYGLMVVENQNQNQSIQSSKSNVVPTGSLSYSTFEVDISGLGVILLELLTGKLVQNSGFDLAAWVHSVLREEWTVEAFDKALISEGASEERMVNLLQVALKCINPSPDVRPSIHQVATMINLIKEEEERSIVSDP